MKAVSSPPGAILFHLGLGVVIVSILAVIFFRYLDDSQIELERQSIIQTKRIIDSSLAVVFASYAVSGRLDDLNQLQGGNPFPLLEQYQLLPPTYHGVRKRDLQSDDEPGWYYLQHRQRVFYKSRYGGTDARFVLVLKYDDLNQSGAFEAGADNFGSLQFVRIDEP